MKKSYLLLVLIVLSCPVEGQTNERQPENRPVSVFNTKVPEHRYDIVSGRPTDHSVTLSVLFYQPATARVEYCSSKGIAKQTKSFAFEAGKPMEVKLDNLTRNERYGYRLIIDNKKEATNYYFRTGRATGDDFLFTITADSHLDENADGTVYSQSLLNAANDSADFHIDLGDTFMTDKYRRDYKDALSQYLAQRYYFSLLKSPLFLVLGNHDGEQGGQRPEMVEWSSRQRTTFFPNPLKDAFYNTVSVQQNYYAWNWGNALFVVLDPFRYTSRSGNDNPWDRTLGKEQYDWLKKTLSESKARYKLVFIHNLVGGADVKGRARGGAEVANLYEWGGYNPDGTNGFDTHRAGWEMPIHELLKKYGVDAVVHGHDHVYAYQQKDGIVYQCLSQPGAFKTGSLRYAGEYGYVNGKMLNVPGYLRVKVKSDGMTFEFVETTANAATDKVVYQYTIKK